MVRRWIVVFSVVLSAFASRVDAGFADWNWLTPGNWSALETANAPAGPTLQRCVIYGYLQVLVGFSAEVWCDTGSGVLQVMNSIPTAGDPSVAMDAAPGVESGLALPFFAFSDPDAAQVWYGVAGQTPELAVDGSLALSLSLAHFSDGTPFLVYRGPGDHIYTATRKPTGEWGQMQLTNNTSGTAVWSVDAAISNDVVHVAYWDDTSKAVRYARKQGATWTFETAKDLSGSSFVSPAVAGDDQGRAYIAFNGRDGLLHYLRRTGPGAWSERTFAPPTPVSFDEDRGPVGLAVDSTRRAHILYATGNGNAPKTLRYVNNPIVGGWQDSVMVSEGGTSIEGFRGIDMVKTGDRPNPRLLGTLALGTFGALALVCGNCQ